MPLWSEYKQEARERGALAFELFVVESTAAAPPEKIKATLPAHLAYQKQQEEAGTLFLAGPLSDDTGEHMKASGMIVYRAESMEQAREIASNDPMHKEGCRTFTLRKWLINEGSLSFGIHLSAQSVSVK